MKKKSKAIVTFKDFEFFTVYEREGGYGRHEKRHLVRRSLQDLKVEHINGRPHRTEWNPISRSYTAGFASVKYCATLTWNGIRQLISNACLYEYVHNTMGILDATGCIPAISLDSGYEGDYGGRYEEEELKRRFKYNYEEEIYKYQGYSHVNCYVAVQVDNNRLEEAVYAVFGKYYADLSDEQRNRIKPHIERYNELCELLNDYIGKLADGECFVEPDSSQFTIDFRELSLDFKEVV